MAQNVMCLSCYRDSVTSVQAESGPRNIMKECG